MKLIQAAQAPLIVEIEFADKKKFPNPIKLAMPYMTLEDFVKWGALVDTDHRNQATEGMAPEARFQLLTFYGPVPSNLHKLKSIVRTPAGTKYVINDRLNHTSVLTEANGKRKLTQDEANEIRKFKPAQLRDLAEQLADIEIESPTVAPTEATAGDNPLEPSEKTESEDSSETGVSTSPSSAQPTPESTTSNSPSDDSDVG